MTSIGSGMSAALIAEMKSDRPLHSTLDLTLDQVYKFANGPIASDSGGMYLDRVTEWGGWARQLDMSGHSLELPSTHVVVNDRDRVLQKATGGPNARNIKQALASVWWRSFELDAADHFNVLNGVVADWKLTGDRQYFFELAPDFLALTAKENNIRKLTDVDWPNIPPENIGLDGQIITGEHRSTSIPDQKGMVRCIMVDQVNQLWLASIGKLFNNSSAIKQVWHGDTDETGSFTHQEVLAGNLWWTVIKDTRAAGSAAAATDVVAIDVDGVETNGDGSGTLVKNPLSVIEFFMTNFVYNDWTAIFPSVPPGRWLTAATHTPLDSTTFTETETFFDDRSYETGHVFKSSDRPIDVLQAWAESLKVYPFWRSNLKLGIRALDNNRAPYTTNHLRQDEGDFRSELTQDTLDAQVRTRIFVRHLLRATDDSYFRTRRVEDARRSDVVAVNQEFPFGKAKVA